MRFEGEGKDAFDLQRALVKGGFTEPMAMGMIANWLQHVYQQAIIREEQELRNIVNL